MGKSWSGTAAETHNAELADAAMAEAVAEATAIAERFRNDSADNPLRPAVGVVLDIGGDGR